MENKSNDFVLEIGCEEIPTTFLKPASQQFLTLFENFLTEKRIKYGKISTTYTPKRLILYVERLSPKADDRTQEYTGPSVASGKDKNGQFLPPAVGFAQKYGLKPDELLLKKLSKGEYFCASIPIYGEKTQTILSNELPSIIAGIKFPKSMVWESSQLRFARPIRNILALYGERQLKMRSVADVKPSGTTFGAGAGFSKKIKIHSAEKYFTTLKNQCIIVDAEERKNRLLKAIGAAAKKQTAEILIDENLLAEVNNLIEHPVALICSFDKKYLNLPEEILVTCMKKKQKFFPLKKHGNISESFVAVKNGISSNIDVIRSGYEKVLTARLEDALFFFHNDLKKPLGSNVEKLKGVAFHENIGTIYEKTLRIIELSKWLCLKIGVEQSIMSDIERGAYLSKTDMVSEIVFEYPELSGTAGRIYAEKGGENSRVCCIIEEHLQPYGPESTLPDFPAALVSVADKIDTISANFSIGLIPTGSEDPYGLRRMATGIVRIFVEHQIDKVPLDELILKSFECLNIPAERQDALKKNLLNFFGQRFETILTTLNYNFDEIRAVMAAGFNNVPDTLQRIKAIAEIRKEPNFEHVVTIFKRVSNIIRQAKKGAHSLSLNSIDENKFREKSEAELFVAINNLEENLRTSLEKKNYTTAFGLLVGLSKHLDKFFEKVMVMAEEEDIKTNRLSLLSKIINLYLPLADISEIQG